VTISLLEAEQTHFKAVPLKASFYLAKPRPGAKANSLLSVQDNYSMKFLSFP
jgi:hypothetical protein